MSLCPDNSRAKHNLADFLLNDGDSSDTERGRALGLLKEASEDLYPPALFSQAMIHYSGVHADEDDELAKIYFELALSHGSAQAANYLAYMHENGLASNIDMTLSARYHKIAAHLGEPESLLLYGRNLRDGVGIPADPKASAKYFEAALLADDAVWPELPQTYELIGNEEALLAAKDIYEGALNKDNPDNTAVGIRANSVAKNGLDRVVQKLSVFTREKNGSAYTATDDVALGMTDIFLGDYHALVIGNNNYQLLPDLSTAQADATRVSNLLRNDYGFETQLLLDGDRSEILDAINSYRFSLEEKDNFLLFYAGHGVFDEEINEGYWQPIDADPQSNTNWISNESVTKSLRGFKSNNILLIADSCYSGIVFRSSEVAKAPTKSADFLRTMLEKRTRVAITSGGLEPVVDLLPGAKHSIFTKHFADALQSNKGFISANELYLQVSENVVASAARLGLKQTPEYAGVLQSGHDGGDFIFARTEGI